MTCEGCMYWSERVAQTDSHGFVEAVCLHPKRTETKFTRHGCRAFVAGEAVDVDDHIRAINQRVRETRERRERE